MDWTNIKNPKCFSKLAHDHTLQPGHIALFGRDFEIPVDDARIKSFSLRPFWGGGER